MSKYDSDTFVKRTMWWRACISIVLALLSVTLMFTNLTISNYGEATQRQLELLQERNDILQRKGVFESCEPVKQSNDHYFESITESQKKLIGDIMKDMQAANQTNQPPVVGSSPKSFSYGDLHKHIQGVMEASKKSSE